LYENLLMMFLAAGFIAAAALVVGALLGPKRTTDDLLEAYESGIPATGSARERFPVHFYLVAMLFIVFDIETAFFFPLAVRFGSLPSSASPTSTSCARACCDGSELTWA